MATLVASAAAGTLSSPLHGQSNAPSTSKGSSHLSVLEGLVVDSIHGGTLNGATILLDGTTLSATTDETGKFRIDSIEPGDYRIAVFHSVLDTLGFSIATPPLRMGADSIRQVVLGTPSAKTLVEKSCPAAKQRLGAGAIMGKVTDPDTHAPLDSTTVSIVWSELQVGQAIGVKRLQSMRKAVTDADGSYVICGVPPNISGTIQAQRNKLATGEVDIAMEGSPLVFQSLMLSATPLDSTAPSRGNAELTGRVTDQNGAPVPGATVAVQGASDTAKTGADGKFRLIGLPSGTRGIYVRKIGFSPGGTAVDLTSEKPVEVAFRLIKSNPVLEAVKIEGKYESALKKNGYTDRKRMGMGRYLGPKDIERLQPQSFSSIFQTLPGFTVNAGQFGSTITYRGKGCVTFYVDGIQQFNVDAAQLENLVRPEQVMAMETYSNTTAPMEYRPPGQSCAIVLVWTNRTVR